MYLGMLEFLSSVWFLISIGHRGCIIMHCIQLSIAVADILYYNITFHEHVKLAYWNINKSLWLDILGWNWNLGVCSSSMVLIWAAVPGTGQHTHTHTHTVAHMDTLSYSIHILSLPIAYTWLQKITCSKSFFLFMGMADAPMWTDLALSTPLKGK